TARAWRPTTREREPARSDGRKPARSDGQAPAPGARKPISLWVPSHSGLSFDLPQRHSATTFRGRVTGDPSGQRSSTGPRTSSGPSRYGVMITVSLPGIEDARTRHQSLDSASVAGNATVT